MRIRKFINYGYQFIDDDDINAVINVLKSDYLTQGPVIREFEKNICDYTKARYCVAVANGTAALHLAVAALQIEKGSEGITSPNTFVASPNSMIYNGLKPVFSDIDSKTYCIDLYTIKTKISKNTKFFIPVHFAGQPCDMGGIKKIADEYGIKIIEDAAHAIGGRYADGSRVGNCRYSDLTIFSFHPVKTITTGEGGAITTNSEDLYELLLMLRSHGITKNEKYLSQNPGPWYYEMHHLGYNYRMTELQAALGITQLRKLNQFVKRRREIVSTYNDSFRDIEWITVPYEDSNVYSAFHLYVLQIDFEIINKSRKQVMNELFKKNIGTQVHYIPVYSQPYYKKIYKYDKQEYPKMEHYYQQALSIPLYPDMSDDEVNYVITNIINLYE